MVNHVSEKCWSAQGRIFVCSLMKQSLSYIEYLSNVRTYITRHRSEVAGTSVS